MKMLMKCDQAFGGDRNLIGYVLRKTFAEKYLFEQDVVFWNWDLHIHALDW